MPDITFSGGPMHGKTVRVNKLEPKFWFKECLYYRKGKTRYIADSTIQKERDIAGLTAKVFHYDPNTTVE